MVPASRSYNLPSTIYVGPYSMSAVLSTLQTLAIEPGWTYLVHQF